ncbi:DNA-binding transcriptional activator of the SARP family [Lentzea fradiae]|uniref:DNA-binding transcriptional activator of the SARP family n=1 Tax=Lentzea fradiae TaxID=200378 RepID=A0A1G7VK68_9PSEU|nr:BTAD domain-containing putative transcriptional regulator [Lentzea fradiae]SDG59958.1 DNA-binding transcriptional activator of the SARP family [Lentzea fradiae]
MSHSEPHLRFNVLGLLECWAGTTRLRLGGPVHERVLVSLLLEPGQVLSVPRLVEAVWEDAPPATAGHQVRKAVAKLRQVIPGGARLITTEGSGYRAVTGWVDLDLDRFLSLLGQAREAAAAGSAAETATLLTRALALWRGPVLSGGGGRLINAASAALEERRLAAVEQLMELRLANREAAELVGELVELVAAYPLRETLHHQLMLALFRSGRQAEALEAYNHLRRLLADELGIDPDVRLTELRDAILRNDPSLVTPQQVHAPAELIPETDTPTCSLPYDLRDFTGRERELDELLDYAREEGGRIVAIDGMGGIGKTSLAVRAAYLLAEQYPDGQLYVDLCGYTPQQPALSVDAVAETLLRQLGVPSDRIPGDAHGKVAEWRAIAAQRRLLLLLDNAGSAAQVRPLLPPGAHSMMLVTSRGRLLDLDGAYWISLGTMSPEASLAMLVDTLGEKRVAAEPAAAAAMAELCGHLPLALRIAAARLHNRPRWTIAYLVDRLGNESRRLDELRSGERSVELTLKLSYLGLTPQHRAALHLLALHPGHNNIDARSAAALLDTGVEEAEEIMEHLLDVHLIQQHELSYYAFHDLVRSFARRLGRQQGTGGERDRGQPEDEVAVGRLLNYYVLATDLACDLAFPGRVVLESELRDDRASLPPLRDGTQARAWLAREQNALRNAVTLAHRMGLHRHAAALARNAVFQFDAKGQFEEYREIAEIAVASSRELGHGALLRVSLSNLAIADWKLGRFYDGIEAATEALNLALRLGDRLGEAKDTGVLGVLLAALGRFDEALSRLQRSIALKRELGARRAEAESLTNLSTLYEQWGHFEEAAAAARRALELNRELGTRDNELVSLADLATAHLGLGQDEEAQRHLDQAVELADDTSPAADRALVLALSAKVAHRRGEHARVATLAERALTLCRSSRTPIRQARVENILGGLELRDGRSQVALHLHGNAYLVASEARYLVEEARALRGLAEAYEALGDVRAAAERRRRADELFGELGIDEQYRRSS